MRAYLKLALLVALTCAVDRVAFAPAREEQAIVQEVKYDAPLCSNEIAVRTNAIREAWADAATRPDVCDAWEMARKEHLRSCRRSHLVDKLIARKLQRPGWRGVQGIGDFMGSVVLRCS